MEPRRHLYPGGRIRMEAHRIGAPEAVWCPVCALPSAWSSFVVITRRDPVPDPSTPLWRGTVVGCPECGWRCDTQAS